MPNPIQSILILDALAPVKKEEIEHLLPGGERRFHRLSTRLGQAPGTFGPPFDWSAVGRALASLVGVVKEESALDGDAGVVVYVAGRAPLPLFVALGQMLNFAPAPVRIVLNPHRGGPWDAYPMAGAVQTRTAPFFDASRLPAHPSPSTARVAVFLSTVGAPAPTDAIARLFQEQNEPLGEIVEIRTSGPGNVTTDDMPSIVEELRSELSRIPGFFPRSGKFALAVAGPAPLAFAAGLALNPTVFGKDVWLANYAAPDYEFSLAVPLQSRATQNVPDAEADKLARREVLDAFLDGIKQLRDTLDPDDFPSFTPNDRQRRGWIQYLHDLKVLREPEGDAFGLSLLRRRLSLGRGLLQAFRGRTTSMQQGFGQLLLLHELFHDGQGIRTSNYQDVGRAGVVLEEVDFAADAFALATLIRWELRTNGLNALRKAPDVAVRWVDWSIRGIEAFDRLEQGDCIEQLYDRRLRRYLIWYLQLERARAVRPGENAKEDINRLFSGRLTVELAPLAGRLDSRFEKLVVGPTPRTELFASLDGHLIREAHRPGFEPGALVDAVKKFQPGPLTSAMGYVIGEHQQVLVPWLDGDTRRE